MTIAQYFALPISEWSEAHEAALAVLFCEQLATTRTIKGSFPCADAETKHHWMQVIQRIHEANMVDIHTAGTVWEGQAVLKWNVSGWPPKKAA